MFWTVPLHPQEFFTAHTAMSVCHTGLLTACEQTSITYTSAVCTVKNS